MFENSVKIQGHSQQTLATGSATTSPLSPGVYDVWGDNDAWIKVDSDKNTAAAVTSGTGYPIRAGNIIPVQVNSPGYLGAAGTGNVYYHKVA